MAGTYGSHVAKVYDDLYAATARSDVAIEAAHVLARVRGAIGRGVGSLLDVACGTGAHLERWRGIVPDLAGVDLSAAMLDRAAERLGTDVRLEEGDFRDLDLGRTFDAVTCLFSSIGYVADLDELDAAVAAMARHVADDGVLVVEPWITPEGWLGERMSLDTVEQRDGLEAVRVLQTLRDGDVVEMDWMLVEPGRDGLVVTRERHRTLLVTRERYLDAFARAGMDAAWDEAGLRGRGLVVARHA